MDLLVTRKGAIRAGSGDYGIIPGSMGTGSYIVRGLGNTAAFNSASHGAGRRMSRNADGGRGARRVRGGTGRARDLHPFGSVLRGRRRPCGR
jgi:tRNA-splicing ligase RtcB (3'-phosphate/5'-hydroxy nucleic acid ligase)